MSLLLQFESLSEYKFTKRKIVNLDPTCILQVSSPGYSTQIGELLITSYRFNKIHLMPDVSGYNIGSLEL